MSKITCPFCFETFPSDQVQFRCANSACTGKAPDPKFATYQGLDPKASYGQVFDATPSKGFFKRGDSHSAKCPTCNRETQKRVCKNCHFELMHDAGTTEEYSIAIIGGRSSGKSTYIATLIRRLKNEVGSNFHASVNAMNDFTRKRYLDDFETPLFRNKRLLPPTQTASVGSKLKTPMVYRITFDNNGKRKAANLVLFDTAGEDMQSLDAMSAEARYICYADAIIFLLDPLQIDAVRDELNGENLPNEDPGAEPIQIIERLRELYERVLKLKAIQKVEKPIAFTLSKVDRLYPIIDPGSGLHHTGEHFGMLNSTDTQSIHTEIQNYIETWIGPSFQNTVQAQFAKFRYFGISAIGSAPTIDGRIETIAPIRVEDPILWIFHELNLIKSKK